MSIDKLPGLDTRTVASRLNGRKIVSAEVLTDEEENPKDTMSVLRLTLDDVGIYQYFSLDGTRISATIVQEPTRT